MSMIKNYLVSAWRNMMRSKLYTVINVFCLTVGISSAILTALYLNHELSYDRHHEHQDRIYRIDGVYHVGGNTSHMAITAFALGPALKLEYSEIQEYVRISPIPDMLIQIEDREFLEQGLAFADSTIFDVFTHEFVYGRAMGSLSEPNTAVLTRSLADKFFGDVDPTGSTFDANGQTFLVKAVIEDLPDNSHIRFDGLLSIRSGGNQDAIYSVEPRLFWSISMNYTYVLMHEGTRVESVLSNMDNFMEKYIEPMGSVIGAKAEFRATPLRDTHFTRILMAADTGNKTNLLVFSLIAVFMVIIAAVNYTNLATARAASRAKEIAIRKVSGAGRMQMMRQFLFESVFVAFISMLISLLLVEVALPGFNTLTDKSFSLTSLFSGGLWIQVLLIVLITGILSGIYPAVFLSQMQPVNILKSGASKSGGSGLLRKVLVVFQFFVAVLLVAGTITVNKQLRFLQKKDLGFKTENRLAVSFHHASVRQSMEAICSDILENPLITGVTKVAGVPGMGANLLAVKIQSGDDMVDGTISSNYIDDMFLSVLEIDLISGRGFARENRSDANASILINEAAVRHFGWHDDPIGKIIQWQFNQDGIPQTTLRVVGVVRDFHYLSQNNPIDPLMLLIPEEETSYYSIIVQHLPGSETEVREFLEGISRSYEPSRLPMIRPLSHGFENQFSAEERLGKIFRIFASICIIIAFMGLFGLSSYVTEQRKKETGIRKVLGSSGAAILWMFYREFSMLIMIAVVIAAPVAWLLLSRWLEDFTYQITMSIVPVMLSGLYSLAIAALTVSYHTLRAARLNPADALRSE